MTEATTVKRAARPSLRDHIDCIVDPGSYAAISEAGGYAEIAGRPVTLGHAGSLFEWAHNRRQPYIALSSGRGAPLRGGPRNMGTLDPIHGMSGGPMFPLMLRRQRVAPVIAAIVHHSFGDSSFFTGLSDFVVQLEGTCMALTGPRVLAIGTSERVSMEELGGAHIHRRNGQVDAVADTLEEVYDLIRRALSFLPTASGALLPLEAAGSAKEAVPAGFPQRGSDGYDMRVIIDGVCDEQSFFEVKADHAPSLMTGFARMDGVPVGVIASNPSVDDAAFTVEACLKATRLIGLCDSFGLPLIFLIDTPGVPAGRPAPREAGVTRAMMLAKAVQLSRVPKCFVVLNRAFGPGLLMTGPARIGTDLVLAWPDARVGFPNEDSADASGVDPEFWAPDGVIVPADTRAALLRHLKVVVGPNPVSKPGGLTSWPVAF